ncbi:MAG: C1 family peptidase [Leptospiraceae bacterium]|nr:C1 family peptidase [Leptospiraceae bacterium]
MVFFNYLSLSRTRNIGVSLVILFLFASGCHLLQNRFFDSRPAWQIEQFPVTESWTDQEIRIPLALVSLPADAPQSYTMPFLVEAGNQGRQASGSAWAAGYLALSQHYRIKKKETDYICSPAFIYNQLVNGKDIGLELYETLGFLTESGCAHYRYMPYDEINLLQRPNAQAIHDAVRHASRGFARVDFMDLDQVKAHVYQNTVVMVTLNIAENFLDLDEDTWEYPAGKSAGRQSLGVVGYDNERNAFLIQNSAGPDWGQSGRVWIPYTWFLHLVQKAWILW